MSHLTTILVLITSVFALPMPQDQGADVTHLFACTDASFKGQCNNMHLQVSKCQNLGDDLKDKISSAGPDVGTFCTMYTKPDCLGRALPFTHPGIRSLGRYTFDDITESVRCDFIAGWDTHP